MKRCASLLAISSGDRGDFNSSSFMLAKKRGMDGAGFCARFDSCCFAPVVSVST